MYLFWTEREKVSRNVIVSTVINNFGKKNLNEPESRGENEARPESKVLGKPNNLSPNMADSLFLLPKNIRNSAFSERDTIMQLLAKEEDSSY